MLVDFCKKTWRYGIMSDVKHEKMVKKQQKTTEKQVRMKQGCPNCGDTENLQVAGRCVTCMSCGWGKCSL